MNMNKGAISLTEVGELYDVGFVKCGNRDGHHDHARSQDDGGAHRARCGRRSSRGEIANSSDREHCRTPADVIRPAGEFRRGRCHGTSLLERSRTEFGTGQRRLGSTWRLRLDRRTASCAAALTGTGSPDPRHGVAVSAPSTGCPRPVPTDGPIARRRCGRRGARVASGTVRSGQLTASCRAFRSPDQG